ncbi:hypothetical protein AMATHDRAFT_144517 [Amanita thiersii Skay4041]|uniref:Phosphatidylinositol N-acetylglucosaminyltransferase subunit H conserved domain-containing protein n=1 Tax=Amanita thiersii Skay4041 TaxID=703135 RepID=A0A2A9NQT4_9AGAR|nr:hypothetical protein AMATHDRAFT_144517 [Amanita thiersii Skay4041]
MQRSWPLQTTNPEYSVLRHSGYREYKVENWYLARDGSGRVVHGTSNLTVFDAVLVAGLSFLWLKVTSRFWHLLCISLALFHIWGKCNQILSESVVLLPSLGIQLETCRGFPLFHKPFSIRREFIPMSSLEDVIINEGLRRWDVRYYLAFLRRRDMNRVMLEVAYKNLLPHHNVLVHVYHDLYSQIPNPTTIHIVPDG